MRCSILHGAVLFRDLHRPLPCFNSGKSLRRTVKTLRCAWDDNSLLTGTASLSQLSGYT